MLKLSLNSTIIDSIDNLETSLKIMDKLDLPIKAIIAVDLLKELKRFKNLCFALSKSYSNN